MEKILIIDDDNDLRDIIVSTLKDQNFDCHSTGSAKEALEMCKDLTFDCILTDVHMPNLSGVDFLCQLSMFEYTPPVIFLSGDNDTKTIRAALRLGAIDFLTKPFNTPELIDVVNRAAQIGMRKRNIFLSQSPQVNKEEQIIKRLKSVKSNKEK